MKVFKLTYEELNALHLATDHAFFKCGEEDESGHDNVVPTILKQGEFYIYGVDKFTKKYPDVDVSELTVIDFVPEEVEI